MGGFAQGPAPGANNNMNMYQNQPSMTMMPYQGDPNRLSGGRATLSGTQGGRQSFKSPGEGTEKQ
jgi:hypothetical protein